MKEIEGALQDQIMKKEGEAEHISFLKAVQEWTSEASEALEIKFCST